MERGQVTRRDLHPGLGNVLCRDHPHLVVACHDRTRVGLAAVVKHGAEGEEGGHGVERGLGQYLVAVGVQDAEDAKDLVQGVIWKKRNWRWGF